MNSYTFRKINFAFKAIFARVVLYRVFSLDVFPAILNDTLTYLKEVMSYKYPRIPLSIIQPWDIK